MFKNRDTKHLQQWRTRQNTSDGLSHASCKTNKSATYMRHGALLTYLLLQAARASIRDNKTEARDDAVHNLLSDAGLDEAACTTAAD